MQFNTYLTSHSELEQIQQTPISEVILEHKSLSRLGNLQTKALLSLTDEALASGLSPVLQWDILCTEQAFQESIALLKRLPLSKFHAVRIQDPGAAEWFCSKHPKIPLHLIVESGNHNLAGLRRWTDYFSPQLQRLVLSTELPESRLQEYCQSLNVACEIMVVGRILFFYTPRRLLSFLAPPTESLDSMEKSLIPAEQPQRKFPTTENQHGTFMFHHKDLFLLDLIPELQKTNLNMLRLDLRHLDFTGAWIRRIAGLLESFDKQKTTQLKIDWPCKITHGFFRANRTDLAIERLKNPFLKDHGETMVGYVVESLKGEHLILLVNKKFSCGKTLLGITPEGKKCTILTDPIKTTTGQTVTDITPDNLYLVPHVKYVTAQTLVYNLSE
ncbi:MAG: U32 family peptidase [SAR324 cluster bacterium]|nr:U32 family peptidase [SAR324 cluster bacterium]